MASGSRPAFVTFKIGGTVYILCDYRGVTVRYRSTASALKQVGKVRAQAIGSGFMEALLGDVLVDFRIHEATYLGRGAMKSAMTRFGGVRGLELGSYKHILQYHESGLEPKAPIAFRTERPTSRAGSNRKQLV